MVGHEFGLGQIGGTFQAHSKRVQTGPVGARLRVVFDAVLAELLGDGGDDRRIQATRQQHAVRYVRHQLTLHSILQCIVDSFNTSRIVLHGIVVHPVATIVPFLTWIDTPVIMARQERLVAFTLSFKGLQLRGNIHRAIAVIADIKRYHTDGVTGNQELVLLFIVEHKGKDTTQVLEEVNTLFAIQGEYDLTVRTRLELVLSGIATANLLMVINLAIDGQHLLTVGREQGLST